MPTELELIALKAEFDLYLTFVKRLVLGLPDSADRARAAVWLKKLRSITHNDHIKLRNEHLKLFLFALHRRSLVGIFERNPPKEELESFHDGLTLLEMTRELIEMTERAKTSKKEGEAAVCPLPPVKTHFSFDLKEYAACQEIPKFGVHCYYAVSSDPIQLWQKAAGQNYPELLAIPNQYEWEMSMAKICDGVLEKEAELDAKLDLEKQKEQGFVFDDGGEEGEQEQEQFSLRPCAAGPDLSGGGNFKWKAGSQLLIYQNYDFSETGEPEDLINQGKQQLEMDEHALNVLDESLPGRQRVHIRVPYYEGLPPDFIERRHHGVYEDVPDAELEDCNQPCEEEEEEEECEDEDDGTEYDEYEDPCAEPPADPCAQEPVDPCPQEPVNPCAQPPAETYVQPPADPCAQQRQSSKTSAGRNRSSSQNYTDKGGQNNNMRNKNLSGSQQQYQQQPNMRQGMCSLHSYGSANNENNAMQAGQQMMTQQYNVMVEQQQPWGQGWAGQCMPNMMNMNNAPAQNFMPYGSGMMPMQGFYNDMQPMQGYYNQDNYQHPTDYQVIPEVLHQQQLQQQQQQLQQQIQPSTPPQKPQPPQQSIQSQKPPQKSQQQPPQVRRPSQQPQKPSQQLQQTSLQQLTPPQKLSGNGINGPNGSMKRSSSTMGRKQSSICRVKFSDEFESPCKR